MSTLLRLPVPPLTLTAALLVTAAAALVQGTIGFGFAIVAVPLLSLVDPRLAPVPQLLLAVPLTGLMLWRERHAVDLRGFFWVLVGRLPGAVCGAALLKLADRGILDLMIAACVILAVAIIAGGRRIPRRRLSEFVAGVASGVFAMIASMGGPPLALLYGETHAPTLRATLAAIFTIGLTITISTRVIVGEISALDLRLSIWQLPALLGGLYCSRWLLGRIEGRRLRIAIFTVSSLAAVGLVLRALLV